MNQQRKWFAVAAAVSVMMLAEPAFAQNAPADTSGTAASASTAKPTKAQRKQARKEARARKNAELSKLEKNGYNPATSNDSTYPQDIQNAEKKANAAPGANQ
ncbi:DUF4148 domain-containing protein [Paraburkholderia acidisoli]|uniref:DUF4148 domain-containing protein n=1 Tax=Paraburkholderia acidisoli TaxID=2571748 RepID=A0A7Z2JJ46_9BURK|nr:DUF4148 domain-containing protein [Paraburkholderia acidisoli]QGZ66426.1 DUF4148 domain-containing protein [Paraburkholderia acidisoli]